MDWVFDMATSRAFNYLTLPREENHVVLMNLVKSEVAPLEPESSTQFVSYRDVPPNHVSLSGDLKNSTRSDNLLLRRRIVHVVGFPFILVRQCVAMAVDNWLLLSSISLKLFCCKIYCYHPIKDLN